ncbi:MAG: hypothetical protein ACOVMG_03700 [Flavobacterium sp.]
MKLLYLFILLSFNIASFSQVLREQIGTSIWQKEQSIYADSTIAYIISYDKQGHKIREFQIYRDTSGKIIDTNIIELDANERVVHFYGNKEHCYYEYDLFGTETKITINRLQDTIVILYEPQYEKGKLVSKKHIYNGKKEIGETTYKYYGDTTVENQSGIVIEKTVYNKMKQKIFIMTETNHNEKKSLRIIKYQRDEEGRVINYSQEVDGVVFKRTKHLFVNGLEKSQIEYFFNPNYIITTTFKYEYWK